MEYVTKPQGIGKFIGELERSDNLGFDLETTGLDCFVDKILLMQVKTANEIFVFNWQELGKKYTDYLIQLIKDSNKKLIGHNLNFDIKFIKHNTGEWLTNLFDLMICETVITNGIEKDRFPSLSYLTQKYLGITLDKTVREKFIGSTVITQEMIVYASEDVMYLEEVMNKQLEIVKEQRHETVIYEIEMPVIAPTASLEYNGVLLDKEKWSGLIKTAEDGVVRLEKELKDSIFERVNFSNCKTIEDVYKLLEIPYKETIANKKLISEPFLKDFHLENIKKEFNPNSHKQIKTVLNLLDFNVKSTGEEILSELDSDDIVISNLLEYRMNQKLISTYGEKFLKLIHPVTGRVHPTFNQFVPQSGRYSSDSPNMQNIPAKKDYRNSFVARPGYKIVGSDQSQQEYRLTGAVSNEKVIIEAYKIGTDMHTSTAVLVYNVSMDKVEKQQRNDAKTINFSILYGTSGYGLAKKQKFYYVNNRGQKKVDGERGDEIIQIFFRGYPTLAKFIEFVNESVLRLGYSTTVNGRKRYFTLKPMYRDDREREQAVEAIKREAFNHIIQGSAGDSIKLTLIRLFYENPFGEDNYRLYNTVHDEIVSEVREDLVEQAKEFQERIMIEALQPFLGEIKAKVESYISDCWEKG